MKTNVLVVTALSAVVAANVFGEAGGDRPDARHAWSVHDVNRPDPQVVDARPGQPPSDAIILFDGTDESVAKNWRNRDGKPSRWISREGEFVCVPGSGPAVTAEKFGDCQLHLEFKTPVGGENATGNSGVIFMGQYEIQILNSYGITPSKSLWKRGNYADGQAGAVYGQSPPLVNVCRPRGEWQIYDIVFHPPYREGERLVDPGSVTVFLNGVVVQDHWQFEGVTMWNRRAPYHAKDREASLCLQDHGNPVPFRNIWIRRIPSRYANTTCGGPGVKQADVAALRHRLAEESLAAAGETSDPAEKLMRLWESFCYEPDRKVRAMIGPAEKACIKSAIERTGCLADENKRQAMLRFVEMLELGKWIGKNGDLRKALE